MGTDCRFIAKVKGEDNANCDRWEMGALLHDCGADDIFIEESDKITFTTVP